MERYHVLPAPAHPRLLLPMASPAVLRGAVTHYRGLRRPPANAARSLLGVVAATGLPLSRHRVVVQVPAGTAGEVAAEDLPLATIARHLGHERLHATFGVRTGANRKATLQLLADDGASVGYAKLGWNSTANAYVETETAALTEVGGRPGLLRAPSVLAAFTQAGRPVVVVEPLPADVRGLRGPQQAPTSAELYTLTPVVRTDVPGSTAHLAALRKRLRELADDPVVSSTVGVGLSLADLVAADPRQVPVQERWHGDLTPWNCARQRDGQLWAWDWESSETDVVAGLDAVHWNFSVARESGPLDRITLAACVEQARPHLSAAGWARDDHGLVAAVYVLTVVERAAALAAREGGWERLWIQPDRLAALVAEGRALLG